MTMLNKLATSIAVALTVSACASTEQASQNSHFAVERPVVVNEPVSQKLNVGHGVVARMNTEDLDAASVLDLAMAEPSNALSPDPVALPVQTETVQVARRTPVELETFPSRKSAAFRVVEIDVVVPEELKVSEANTRVPNAHIVWREDPIGDRKEQIKTIMEDAIAQGAQGISGPRDVVMQVRVKMFHALTELTRYTTGGRHNIQFDYALYDALTGQMIGEPAAVDASLKAFGGRRAKAAEARGDTQKVRITRSVAQKIEEALIAPAQAS